MAKKALRHRLSILSHLFGSTTIDADPRATPDEIEVVHNLYAEYQDNLAVPAAGTIRFPNNSTDLDEFEDLIFVVEPGDHVELKVYTAGDVLVAYFAWDRTGESTPGVFALAGCTGAGAGANVMEYCTLASVGGTDSNLQIFRIGKPS